MNELHVQDVFETIIKNPGIDTPEVCVKNHDHIVNEDLLEGPFLAAWLIQNEKESWERTCDAVDELLQSGQITFSDDGELHAI